MKNSLIFLSALLILGCQQKTRESRVDYTLGEIAYAFPVSEEARENFDKGLLLLHSFEYDDAQEVFRLAREKDENEVMAYWGEAMCEYKALWGLQDVEAGREIMSRLGDTREERLAKAEEGIEREFWEGVEILYGEGELNERNEAYASHMETLYEKYPGDMEVAAFYALALMWADYKNQEYLDKSSRITAGIIEENPTHPGALHYLIHSNDDPEYARLAKEAADKYARVAPDATHALHMPSHIYVALGMWNEVVSSNTESYQASLNRVERKELDGSKRGYHSMAWLHYGLLQQGDYDRATRVLQEMIGYNYDSTGSDSYTIMMQNQQRIETGTWPEELEPVDAGYTKLGLESKSQKHFFYGLLAYDRGDSEALKQEINDLYLQVEAAKLVVGEDGVALCSAGPTRFAPTETSITRTNVVIHQMEALLAMMNDKEATAEDHLKKAVALESSVDYDSGPPFIAYPSFEQYGDWLLEQDRPAEALVMFEESLESRTNRSKALRGKIHALEMPGRPEEAQEAREILDVFWKRESIALQYGL